MACRVGMTTDPAARKSYWQGQHPTMRNWTILASGLSREEAQKKEDDFARFGNCTASGGGNDPDRLKAWSVYRFEY